MASIPANPLTQTPNTSSATTRQPNSTTPASASSSNSTFLMPTSPIRQRKAHAESYKPKIITTVGARPACLVMLHMASGKELQLSSLLQLRAILSNLSTPHLISLLSS